MQKVKSARKRACADLGNAYPPPCGTEPVYAGVGLGSFQSTAVIFFLVERTYDPNATLKFYL